MNLRPFAAPALAALALASLAAVPPSSTGPAWGEAPGPYPMRAHAAADTLPSSDFAIRNVRLFDGREVAEGYTVLVRSGRVVEAGFGIRIPPGVPVVEGRGRTLLPGFIDAHVHTFDPDALVQSLAFGVTLNLDMFTQPALLAEWRAEQAEGRAFHRADIRGAGYMATAPGGHGTQYGTPVPTVDSPEDAASWVATRAAEGADHVKIILEDGSAHGISLNTLDQATLEALVAESHHHGLRAVVHVSTLEDAVRAFEAGADGLVHIWVDRTPTPDFAAEMAERGMFIIPTLTVMESVRGVASGQGLLGDETLVGLLPPGARLSLGSSFPAGPGTSWVAIRESLVTLHQAGVPILAGSDTPNPGTTHGASLHREMELLVEMGLSPLEALRSATSVPARAFGLEGRGIIASGSRADLVLVEGDPTRDITATRRIMGVWKEGQVFDHDGLRTRVAAMVAEAGAPPPAPEMVDGVIPVSDFDDGTLATRFGAGWSETSDAMAGGSSTARLEVAEGGAVGTSHALRITGELKTGAPFPWAGAMLFPGAQPMAPVDLSAASGIAFQARGTGPGFQLFIFTRGGGPAPVAREFPVGEDWGDVFVPWSAFPNVDPSEITGIVVSAGPEAGAFDLWVDQVSFR
jgi:imidazolonepropionase-like amidohydrolase